MHYPLFRTVTLDSVTVPSFYSRHALGFQNHFSKCLQQVCFKTNQFHIFRKDEHISNHIDIMSKWIVNSQRNCLNSQLNIIILQNIYNHLSQYDMSKIWVKLSNNFLKANYRATETMRFLKHAQIWNASSTHQYSYKIELVSRFLPINKFSRFSCNMHYRYLESKKRNVYVIFLYI